MNIAPSVQGAVNQATDAVGIYALKKSLMVQAQSSLQLIQAVKQAPTAAAVQQRPTSGPGQFVDVKV